MVKGGKKKDKKGVTEAVASLTLEENPGPSVTPSTSSLAAGGTTPVEQQGAVAAPAAQQKQPTTKPVEEGDDGLALGGGKKKRSRGGKKKKDTTEGTISTEPMGYNPIASVPSQQTGPTTQQSRPPFQQQQSGGRGDSSLPPRQPGPALQQQQSGGRGVGIVPPQQPGPPTQHQQPWGHGASYVRPQQPGPPTQHQQQWGHGPSHVPPQQPGPPTQHQQPWGHGASYVRPQQPGPPTQHQQPWGHGASHVPPQQPGPPTQHQQPWGHVPPQQPAPPIHQQQPAPPIQQQQLAPPIQQQQPAPPIQQQPWGRGESNVPQQTRSQGRGRGAPPPQQSSAPAAPGRGPAPQAIPPQQPSSSQQQSSGAPSQYAPKQSYVATRFQLPKMIRRAGIPARPITVITNYLPMTIKPIKVFRYDVSITPDRPKKMVPKVFDVVKAKFFPKNLIAFDQMKNCYSLRPLLKPTQDRLTTEVDLADDNGKVIKFQISMKETGILDFQSLLTYMKEGTALCPPTETIQCVDVILRQGSLMNYVKAGRQFFTRPRNPIDLGDGLEMWTGLFQSAIFTSAPFINIDVAHKGFPKFMTLIDVLTNEFRLDPRRPLEDQRGTDALYHYLKGLRVTATITDAGSSRVQKREFICNGLVKPASRMEFKLGDDGKSKTITVEKYFAEVKGQRLRYPNLNCMWVGPRNKQIYYPMELLHVVYGQALNKQLNEKQLSKMVREAATPPWDRKKKIEECIKDMNYPRNEFFKEFGMAISTEFLEVNAKILKPPILSVGDGTVEPRRGVWQARRFLQPSAMLAWGFLVVETDSSRLDCNSMIQSFQRVGKQMGMNVQEPKLVNLNVRLNELLGKFRSAWDDNIKLLFVIVNTRMKNTYQKVKQLAELDVGILTQCIRDVTAQNRMNEQTIRNILLKVNSKLMGVNQSLDVRCAPQCLKDGGVMVVGADVTHPSPEQTDIPSIAAVSASIDPKCYLYNIELSIQTPKKEMIVQFETMMEEHLRVYKKNQNTLPRKIYVFRDGVSEGQFAQVMNSELVAIYSAYHKISGGKGKPEVLFMLVQKRHHTRFFSDRNNAQNVEPGTVVDTKIVHNSEMDFYMVSHQAIKGTARPTRYYGVRNDGNIAIEEIEQLTYYLCHLYSRCQRSVSYPTPTYYAHLACTRAKNLTQGREHFDNTSLEISPKRLHVLDRMLDYSRMFFV
ncbi:protein argonaute-2-like isoform X2 [Leptidea sinapis]|uniref:protein argonaute-2-like isoform X2 n=1 Tax=Leptidea sinapis TaxID=189913 RepID=UPI0021C458DF|nr:protein argonaute-2-like isoform X2 [Leptidea sinapis]